MEAPKAYSLGKEYKLCSIKEIEALFETGEFIKKYPLKLVYKKQALEKTNAKPLQMVFSVPKRIQKHATDRNKIKRILREAIRFQRHSLEKFLLEKETKLNLMIIYIDRQEIPFAVLERKITKLFDELIKQLSNEIQ
ncbi:MAG: ribonuclease P protein component [Bacteroidota bacterium]